MNQVADSRELRRAVDAYERAHGVGSEYVALQAALATEEGRPDKAQRSGGAGGGKGSWGAEEDRTAAQHTEAHTDGPGADGGAGREGGWSASGPTGALSGAAFGGAAG